MATTQTTDQLLSAARSIINTHLVDLSSYIYTDVNS
jgi:hypothetical protein